MTESVLRRISCPVHICRAQIRILTIGNDFSCDAPADKPQEYERSLRLSWAAQWPCSACRIPGDISQCAEALPALYLTSVSFLSEPLLEQRALSETQLSPWCSWGSMPSWLGHHRAWPRPRYVEEATPMGAARTLSTGISYHQASSLAVSDSHVLTCRSSARWVQSPAAWKSWKTSCAPE